MSKSSNTLKILKGTTTYTCDLYTTTAEAGQYGYMPVKVGSSTLYAALTTNTSDTHETTPLHHKKTGGTEYRVAQHSYFNLVVNGGANRTITVKYTPPWTTTATTETITTSNKTLRLAYGTSINISASVPTGFKIDSLEVL
jgi:hypothetical protein